MGRSRSETGGGGEEEGNNVAGPGDGGEGEGSGSEDGSDWRDAEEGDASGKGIETGIGRSVTRGADIEDWGNGGERSSAD